MSDDRKIMTIEQLQSAVDQLDQFAQFLGVELEVDRLKDGGYVIVARPKVRIGRNSGLEIGHVDIG